VFFLGRRVLFRVMRVVIGAAKSSQVITLPIAKSQTRSKQNKGMQKFSSVYNKRGVLLPVWISGGE
jgi:hypothetical protein